MVSASATTEQRIKGQIGHPAACMIESKVFLRGVRRPGGCELWPMPTAPLLVGSGRSVAAENVSTVSVHNSVGKPDAICATPRQSSSCFALLKI